MLFTPNAIITDAKLLQGDFQKSKSVFVPGRPYHSLSYRLAGTVTTSWQDQTLVSTQGTLTFIPKGFGYHTSILESGKLMVIYFNCMDEYDTLLPMVLTPKQPRTFENHFKALSEIYRPGMERDYQCLAWTYHILADFDSQLSESTRPRIPSRMLEARQYIDQNFHQPLSVSILAFHASVSETYFRKEFRQYFGLSPVAYIQKIRIENAKSLLLTGYYQVSEVATRCGFDSISYFSYVFHNQTGMTPSQYMGKL